MSRAVDLHWSFSRTKKGEPEIELTHNWDQEDAYSGGRNFGHLAYAVDDIYATCSHLRAQVIILRPPRWSHGLCSLTRPDSRCFNAMAALEPAEPWLSMPNQAMW